MYCIQKVAIEINLEGELFGKMKLPIVVIRIIFSKHELIIL